MTIPLYTNNGTYGCVFRPAVPCRTGNTANLVSKVFKNPHKDYAREEIELHNHVVHQIDPQGNFTVRLVESCKIPVNQFPFGEIKKCKNFTFVERGAKELDQIVYEYGGVDLKMGARLYSFEEMFSALGPVFSGLVTLKDKRYVHLDIKPDNLVYNSDTKKLALIDFGLATKVNKLYVPGNLYIFRHPYPYYPPEFSLAANQIEGVDKYNPKTNVAYLLTYINALYRKNKTPELALLKTRTMDTHAVLDPKKVDVYMLGATILELLHMCVAHKTTDMSKGRRFFAAVFTLIGKMTAGSINRITPEDAYKEWKSIRTVSPSPVSPPKPSPIRFRKRPSPEKPTRVCPSGYVLNPVTNRCNKVKVVECPPGKIKNPVTKRCKANGCPTGKELNPATNRCIKACSPSQERNPVTKRCKKKA